MKTLRTAATVLAGLSLATAPVLTACSQSTQGSGSSNSATRLDDGQGEGQGR